MTPPYERGAWVLADVDGGHYGKVLGCVPLYSDEEPKERGDWIVVVRTASGILSVHGNQVFAG